MSLTLPPVSPDSPELELSLFNVGTSSGLRLLLLSGGGFEKLVVPTVTALIKHPEKGYILFDTGYAQRTIEALTPWPYALYIHLMGISIRREENLVRQLERKGIKGDDIGAILLSHLHFDHTGGLYDFPQAEIFVERQEWLSGQVSKPQAIFRGNLPESYDGIEGHRLKLLDFDGAGKPYGFIPKAIDLFGDGSMLLLPLPGHSPGHMGLLLNKANGRRVFLTGDAAYLRDNYRENKPPSRVMRGMIADYEAFLESLELLRNFSWDHPEVLLVPTHCPDTWREIEQDFP